MKVLLVEDNDDHADLIKENFKEMGKVENLFHVRDGAQALDYLFGRGDFSDPAKSPRPDIILLDLRLPKVDGLEVLKAIKDDEQLSLIPVVILTSSSADMDVVQAYAKRANSYLVKPVSFDAFSKLLKDFGFYWLDWNKYAQ